LAKLSINFNLIYFRGAVINKLANVDDFVEKSLQRISQDSLIVSNAIYLGWILKALVLRNHPLLVRTTKVVLDYLKSEDTEVAIQVLKNYWRFVKW